MASFIESATLKVIDESSAQITKINAELKKLAATAKGIKSTKIEFKIDDKGIAQSIKNMEKLRAEMGRLKGGATKIELKVETGGLAEAERRLAQLRRTAERPITVATRGAAAAEEGRIGRGNVPGIIRGRGESGVFPGARGFATGLGLGFGGFIGSLNAVETAGYAAALALRKLASEGEKRDRANLQTNVMATDAQKAVFADLDAKREESAARWKATPEADRKEEDRPPPLAMSKTEYKSLRTSLLGDVQAEGATEEERAKGRAAAAGNIADYLVKNVLPRIYAQNPEQGPEKAQEGLRKIIQAVNLASTEIVNDADVVDKKTGKITGKKGELSAEGKRVIEGIQVAMAAEPELQPSLIKTVLANLKTAGYSLSSDAIARVLINAGARGQRAGNELFRAIKAASGVVDVKKFNKQLDAMGLMEPGTAKYVKGKYVAGSGIPVGGNMLATDPARWFHDYFGPAMLKEMNSPAGLIERQKQENAEAKTAGRTPEKVKKLTSLDDEDLKNADIVNYINRKYAGVAATAAQGAADLILTWGQMQQQLEQARLGMQQPLTPAMEKSWATQKDNVLTKVGDAFGDAGDEVAKKFDLAGWLKSLSEGIEAHPEATVTAGLVGAAGALVGAAWALKAAAGFLAGKGVIPTPGGAPEVVPGGKPGAPRAEPWGSPEGPPVELPTGPKIGPVVAESIAAQVARGLFRYLGPPGILLGSTVPAGVPDVKSDRELRLEELNSQLDKAKTELTTAQQGQEEAKTKRGAEQWGDRVGELQSTITGLQNSIIQLTTKWPEAKPLAVPPGNRPTVQQLNEERDRRLGKLPPLPPPAWLDDAKRAQEVIPKIPTTPQPWPADKGPSSMDLIKSTLDNAGQSILTGAQELGQSSNTFQGVFTTGAAAIEGAGSSAAAALETGAAGAGATFGNTALGIIQSAKINVNVNTNASGGAGKGDPGEQSKAA